jgi:hypothetical protein
MPPLSEGGPRVEVEQSHSSGTIPLAAFLENPMKPIRLLLVALLPFVALAAAAPTIPPIQKLAGLTPGENAFQASGSAKPIVLKSEKEAAEYFPAQELAKLTKQVDFNSQIVLLFAWQGSGQDKQDYTVAESYPEQIRFTYTPGMTRDLRPHIYIYALRANVTWSAK